MAITLQEAKVGMSEKIDQSVIELFQQSSMLLDALTFDNAVSPGTGGSTLTYGYVQEKTPSTAKVRKLNEEYTPGHAVRQQKSTNLIIFGGSFEIDRVIQSTEGQINEVNFQLEKKVKAASAYFHNLVINGNSAASGTGVLNTFDGLKKLLTGSQTEITTDVDISTEALMETNKNQAVDDIADFISTLIGMPDMLIMNKKMQTKVASIGRRLGFHELLKDDFGRTIKNFDGIPMMDAGQIYDETSQKLIDVIPINADGTSEIYAIKIGLDAFHGISTQGDKIIRQYLPDFTTSGAVKSGEVEMIAGVALKNTLMAGVLKGVKIKEAAV